ncbi:MAG: PQQ-binding-like beta-propeller repeat protein [Blastocatellia bacterium]
MLTRLAAYIFIAVLILSPVFTTRTTGQSGDGARQDITWLNMVNCSANGSNLQKTGGRSDTADAGARSRQTITAGDAYVEFTVSEVNKILYFGLSDGAIGTDFAEIDFAIKLTELGIADVRENNTYKAETPYRLGDVFRIADESGVVKYYHNGTLMFVSQQRPTYPLIADAVLIGAGAKIDNAVIGALAVTTAAEWKMFQRDPAHTGYATGSRIDTNNASTLTEGWRFSTGGWVTGTPVIANGTAYVGSWDGKMYALRESDGSLVWSFAASTYNDSRCDPGSFGINSTAALSDGKLYFGAGDAKLYALDAATGNLLWQRQLGNPDEGYHIFASPVVFDNKIYIGLASHCVNPCVRGELLCLDANNGNILWTFFTAPAGSLGGGVWSSCAVDPNRRTIYVGTGNYCSGEDTYSSTVLALNADTGSLVWSFKKLAPGDTRNFDFGASPILFDTIGIPMLVIGSKDGHCFALHRQTGELLWDTVVTDGNSAGGGIISSAAVYNGMVFMGATVQAATGKLVALDARTGSKVWEVPQANPVIGATAVSGGAVFIGVLDGTVRAYDAQSGNLLWRATRSTFYGGVSITQDRIFVGSANGSVYSFGLAGVIPQPRASISITSPVTGFQVKKGKKFDITWTVSGDVSRVDVSISRDGGTTWTALAENIDATAGTIRVKAKKPKSETVIVRVADSSDSSVSDQTGAFRIF